MRSPATCRDWARVFEAELVDDAVPEELREQASAHEAACAQCAAERETWRALAALPEERAGTDAAFAQGVLAALDRSKVIRVRRWWAAVAVATAAAAAVLLVLRARHQAPPASPVEVASVQVSELSGEVKVDGAPAAVAGAVRPSSVVSTGAGRACLTVDPRVRLCMDHDTEVAVADVTLAHRRVDLRRGRVVVSLAPQPAGSTFSVSTRAGSVTAIGTAFAVDASGDAVVARVLHGVVLVRSGAAEQRLGAHERMVLGAQVRSTCSDDEVRADQALLDGRPSPGPAPSAASTIPSVDIGALPIASASAAPQPSPADLLRTARSQRGDRELAQAAGTYRKLQSLYPASVEARASYVSLGELQLGGLNDPGGALRSFDAYLASPGTLTEEARYGRIRALRALGRGDEAQAAVSSFLADYPSSAEAAALRAERAPSNPK